MKQAGKHPVVIRKFLVKLFSKNFEDRRLFEKRRHPKTFIIFYQPYSTAAGPARQAEWSGRGW
ncbi:hypothetical protein CFR78_13215 [Komagataeibacter rhaeticus]|nr:hypothetical protein CFR78_13215 [Komagataeibacter rhaeticus]